MQMLREALLLHDDHRFRVADHCIKRLEVGLVLCMCVRVWLLIGPSLEPSSSRLRLSNEWMEV